MSLPIKIFIAFSHKDNELQKELKNALQPLVLLKKATLWDDHEVEAGSDWDVVIRRNLLEADIVLLLFSADALASKYFLDEVEVAVERHNGLQAIAIPVILRPCGWDDFADFSKIEALPEKARPVKSWPDRDEALESVFRGISKLVNRLLTERKETANQSEADRRIAIADRERAENAAAENDESDRLALEKAAQKRRADLERTQNEAAERAAAERLAAEQTDRLFELHLRDAKQYLEDGDFHNADRFALEALQIRPNDPTALDLRRALKAARDQARTPFNWKPFAISAGVLAVVAFSFVGLKNCKSEPVLPPKQEEKAADQTVTQPLDDSEKVNPTVSGPIVGPKNEEKKAKPKPKPAEPVVESPKTSPIDAILAEIEASMVGVAGGSFEMGDTFGDGDSKEKPVHSVAVSSFRISKFVVKQSWYNAIVGSNPSSSNGDTLPVETVSWEEARAFIKKVNDLSGKNYRLPTEAEWEFAARGGMKSQHFRYSGSNSLSDVAWFDDNSGSKTHPVGQKKANELGLFDMSGNVWEWCQDWLGDYSASSQTNPKGPNSGSYRIIRGGSWNYAAFYCRSSHRGWGTPAERYNYVGFRLARSF